MLENILFSAESSKKTLLRKWNGGTCPQEYKEASTKGIVMGTYHHFHKVMENYTETHAILLPGEILGYKREDLNLLPSELTKKVSGYILIL